MCEWADGISGLIQETSPNPATLASARQAMSQQTANAQTTIRFYQAECLGTLNDSRIYCMRLIGSAYEIKPAPILEVIGANGEMLGFLNLGASRHDLLASAIYQLSLAARRSHGLPYLWSAEDDEDEEP